MARPAKKLIHTPEQQIKDFFIDESMARVYPKNGYNILWFMEELLSKEDLKKDFWVNFKKNILDLLSRDENVSSYCEKNNGNLNLSNPAIKKLWIEEFYSILSDKLQEDGNKKEKRLKI